MGAIRDRLWGFVGGVSQANLDSIESKIPSALTANATFLAIGSPSAAQVATQVQRLTKEMNALIRFLNGDFSVDDT